MLAHLRLDAVLGQFREVDFVDARILIAVLDLPAAVADADVDAGEQVALFGREWVAQAAERDREMARRLGPPINSLAQREALQCSASRGATRNLPG